jgi:hypothetical protein
VSRTPAEASAAPADQAPSVWERAEAVLVGLGAWSAIGGGLFAAGWPARAMALAGLPPAPALLVRHLAVLYAILGVGFLLEYRRSHGVTLLVAAKGISAAFLLASWVGEWLGVLAVLFVAEAGQAAVIRLVHEVAHHHRWSRIRLQLVSPVGERIRPAGGG